MRYCARCLYPENHPYGMVFDAEGVCMGCRIHEEKDRLDWTARFERLRRITTENRARMGNSGFDCIVPVTGGGDSFFIVHTVKNELGMNPLLVHYNPHYNTRAGIRNLANLATVFDCDVVTSTPRPELLQRITRHTLRQFVSMYWQVLAGTLTFPVQVAVKFRIPLIVWGVHGWSEQTGMFSHLDEVEMTERCRKEHAMLGIAAEDLIDADAGITAADVAPFVYPDDTELEIIGVRGIYLSNYMRWDAKAQHERMIELYGYEAAPQQRTFNTYEDVHCHHSAGLHDWLKFRKLGYGKVTDHASREIRLRRMTREQGAELVRRYETLEPEDLSLFLDWVGMRREDFEACVDDRRDPKAWRRDGADGWTRLSGGLESPGAEAIEAARLPLLEPWSDYRLTPIGEAGTPDDDYLLMGRGYIDAHDYGAVEPKPDGGPTPRVWTPPTIRGAGGFG